MLEILKKIGVPASVALVVVALATFVPMFFGIDERYAKEEKTQAELEKISRQVQDIATEVNRMAGAQETLLAVLVNRASQPTPAPVVRSQPERRSPPTASVLPTPAPAPAPAARPPVTTVMPPSATVSNDVKKLDELRKDTQEVQRRIQEIQKY